VRRQIHGASSIDSAPSKEDVGMFMKKCVRVVFILGLLLRFSTLHASAVPILSMQPSSQTVQPGQSFSLDVDITNVTDLFSFQFDITFDPTVLSATNITEGPFLPGGGSTFFVPGTIDNTAGTISFTADTLIGAISGVTGSDILATASFQALALGTSPITLSNPILQDSNLMDIASNIMNGAVTVVPEPAPWLLFTTGLVSLLLYGWRRKQ